MPVVQPDPSYDYTAKIKPATVRWVMPGWSYRSAASVVLASGYVHYIPIFVSEPTTYIRIGIDVSAAGAGGTLARLGIYAWNNGVPGALILDAGTVAIDAIAQVEIVISQLLQRGYYFLAIVCNDANAACNGPNDSSMVTCPVSGVNGANTYLFGVVLSISGQVAQVAGGLSNPAVAPNALQVANYAVVKLREN